MENKDLEIFDDRLDRYLRNRMDSDEAALFMQELAENPELMERARAVALMIREMRRVQAAADRRVINMVAAMTEEEFREVACEPLTESVELSPLERFVWEHTSYRDDDPLAVRAFMRLPGDTENRAAAKRRHIIRPKREEYEPDNHGASLEDEIVEELHTGAEPDSEADLSQEPWRRKPERSDGDATTVVTEPEDRPRPYDRFTKIMLFVGLACLLGFGIFTLWDKFLDNKAGNLCETAYSTYTASLADESKGTPEIRERLKGIFYDVEHGQPSDDIWWRIKEVYWKASDHDPDFAPYIDDIEWNLAIMDIKMGDRDTAVIRLENIVKRKTAGPANLQAARQLIDEIKSL